MRGSEHGIIRQRCMSWNTIVGQERAKHALKQTMLSGRIAHAYVFHGPDGVGKRAAAFALGKALQCEELRDGDACGVCGPCLKSQKGLHPDIHVWMPTTKDAPHTDIAPRLQALAENPYGTVDFQSRPSMSSEATSSNKQVFYSVDTINLEIRRALSFHRVEGKYRVGIFLDADQFRTEAANAFLKLLEEPGEKTVFILITNRIDHLLPTILSRCQQMRFDPLSVDEIAGALVEREHQDPTTASVLARMADGSLSRAMVLSGSEELPLVREDVMDFLRQSYLGRGDVIIPLVDAMSSRGREHTKFLLLICLGLLRDLMLIADANSPELIVNVDQADVLTKFVTNLSDARIPEMIEAVEQTSYLIERNVNVRLALISLSRVLAAAMRGDRNAKVTTSLA